MNKQYQLALEEALTWVETNFKTIGIVVSGSIIRGNPHHNSDLDIFVIHENPFRQRIQKYFNGVPCEILINNFKHVYQYFEKELNANQPVSADILSTGKIYKGHDNIEFKRMIEAAQMYAVKSPVISEKKNLYVRYSIANAFEDATDTMDADKQTTLYFLNKVIVEIIDYVFLMEGKPLPRAKERFSCLKKINPEISKLVSEFYFENDLRLKYSIVRNLVTKTIGEQGFFEWVSPEE
jgi:hypothetical protein